MPERITYPSHDLTVELAGAAALTERVRLVSTIVILPAHDAVAVAKQMASVDVLSGGRLTVGVGVGGREHDYQAIGAPFDRRWQRMDEQVATMRRIWAGEPPFEGADPVGPPPVQPGGPPIIAGVMGPKAIARAAHWADGVDGAWTMDGSLEHMQRVVRPHPRRVARRRARRAAAAVLEHLVRARARRRGAAARLRVRLPARSSARRSATGSAGVVNCFTADALRRAVVDTRARQAPTSSSSCPRPPDPDELGRTIDALGDLEELARVELGV